MNVTPRGDRVLIEVDYNAEKVTAGGIVIPEATKAAPQRGKILAVGPGYLAPDGVLHPVTGVEVGDVVIYAKHAGTEVEHDGDEKLALYREQDILAVVNA